MNYQEFFHSEDWNVLVILDAMRYDVFKRCNTIKGKLQQVDTEASCTPQWLNQTFPDEYPYTYVSGNPICTSRVDVNGYKGGDHFEEVIDVWDSGWDQTYRTVLPKTMTKYAYPYLAREKVIIHYMQPHFPALGKTQFDLNKGGWIPMDGAVAFVGTDFHQKEADIKVMRVAYVENALLVLYEMLALLEDIPQEQKVILTTDHGELLGESDLRGHLCEINHPILRNVPWFEVKR